jgi:hypothetical protein
MGLRTGTSGLFLSTWFWLLGSIIHRTFFLLAMQLSDFQENLPIMILRLLALKLHQTTCRHSCYSLIPTSSAIEWFFQMTHLISLMHPNWNVILYVQATIFKITIQIKISDKSQHITVLLFGLFLCPQSGSVLGHKTLKEVAQTYIFLFLESGTTLFSTISGKK